MPQSPGVYCESTLSHWIPRIFTRERENKNPNKNRNVEFTYSLFTVIIIIKLIKQLNYTGAWQKVGYSMVL